LALRIILDTLQDFRGKILVPVILVDDVVRNAIPIEKAVRFVESEALWVHVIQRCNRAFFIGVKSRAGQRIGIEQVVMNALVDTGDYVRDVGCALGDGSKSVCHGGEVGRPGADGGAGTGYLVPSEATEHLLAIGAGESSGIRQAGGQGHLVTLQKTAESAAQVDLKGVPLKDHVAHIRQENLFR
jgi:hypothetical protein